MYVDRVNTRSNKRETNFAYGLEQQKVNSHRLLNILGNFQHYVFLRGLWSFWS